MSRVADSSFLITLFDPDDDRRPQAVREAEDPEPILVPPEVVTETLGILHGHIGYRAAATLWQDLGTLANVILLNSTQDEEIEPVFLAAEGRLSRTDAAVVAHCLREDGQPLCYDEDIAAAWQAHRDQA